MIFELLVMMNPIAPAEPGKPWLATEWTWSNNFKKVDLTIRDGVKWSDGKDMTAEDVAYTFQLVKDTKALNGNAIPYETITQDGNKVSLTFPTSQFVNQSKVLTQFVVPKHQWSTLADPATDTLKQPIGTGPYTLKSFTAQTTTLTVRDSYWQDLPAVKELRYTRTTTTTRRPPPGPTGPASGASSSSQLPASTPTRTSWRTSLVVPAEPGHPRACGSTRRSPFADVHAPRDGPRHQPRRHLQHR